MKNDNSPVQSRVPGVYFVIFLRQNDNGPVQSRVPRCIFLLKMTTARCKVGSRRVHFQCKTKTAPCKVGSRTKQMMPDEKANNPKGGELLTCFAYCVRAIFHLSSCQRVTQNSQPNATSAIGKSKSTNEGEVKDQCLTAHTNVNSPFKNNVS